MASKILYVCQEITPYLPETESSRLCRALTQAMQERGNEIRTFMPRYGCINERRHQLHEVIRLSGMNLIIDDNDHQLIIKVASIPSARVQIYFIDNDDYFSRKAVLTDAEGRYFPDNDERAIFFARGVLETVKKLRWTPTVVHCHGWFSGVVPVYLKHVFADDPIFRDDRRLALRRRLPRRARPGLRPEDRRRGRRGQKSGDSLRSVIRKPLPLRYGVCRRRGGGVRKGRSRRVGDRPCERETGARIPIARGCGLFR